MNFKISNGLNFISIEMFGLGSYFRLRYPAAMVWDDCRGSIGQYLCLLPIDETDRKFLQEKIKINLFEDYTNREEELYKLLEPLMSLFRNGEYNLYFQNTNYTEQATIYSGNQSQVFKPSWYVVYPDLVEIEKTALKTKEHKAYVKAQNLEKYNIGIIETTTTSIYEWKDNFYVATKPLDQLSQERINYFEEEINAGKRPFAIIIEAVRYGKDEYSQSFVLDGHHKLQAYKNLNIKPPCAIITKMYIDIGEIEFDIEEMTKYMYPWQIEHIVKNWDEEYCPQPKQFLPKVSFTEKLIQKINFIANNTQNKIKRKIEEFNYWKSMTWLYRARLFHYIESALFIIILIVVILGIISSL